MEHDPARLIAGVTKVASLPTVYLNLEEAVRKTGTTNQDLARIINEDAGMSARLLRIANSAFYNFPGKVDTITQAITIIGVNQLRDLLLACSMVSIFKDISEELVTMESFWRHSVACGVSARTIASLRRESNVERFFVAGLLHDIGRLILYMLRAPEMASVMEKAQKEHNLLYKEEYEFFGYHHAKIGGLLLKAWKLPPSLIESTAYHHTPHRAKQYALDTAIVHISDVLANAMQMGSSGEKLVPEASQEAWELIGLPESALDLVIDSLFEQYALVVKFILKDVD